MQHACSPSPSLLYSFCMGLLPTFRRSRRVTLTTLLRWSIRRRLRGSTGNWKISSVKLQTTCWLLSIPAYRQTRLLDTSHRTHSAHGSPASRDETTEQYYLCL